jgi:diacylglycerol kinase (ATP)
MRKAMNTSSPDPDPDLPRKGSFQRLARSFRFAGRGARLLVASECNARWHLVATVTVLAAGFSFGLSQAEWIAIVLCVGLVWAAEAANTALEWLCNCVTQKHDERIRNIKDVAAGGVLCAAIAAAIVGGIIFVPRLLQAWL